MFSTSSAASSSRKVPPKKPKSDGHKLQVALPSSRPSTLRLAQQSSKKHTEEGKQQNLTSTTTTIPTAAAPTFVHQAPSSSYQPGDIEGEAKQTSKPPPYRACEEVERKAQFKANKEATKQHASTQVALALRKAKRHEQEKARRGLRHATSLIPTEIIPRRLEGPNPEVVEACTMRPQGLDEDTMIANMTDVHESFDSNKASSFVGPVLEPEDDDL